MAALAADLGVSHTSVGVNSGVRSAIDDALARAQALIPTTQLPYLPTTPELRGAPEWYPFEHQVWKVGEDIRQQFRREPRLRKDAALQLQIMHVACNRRALRGRQSFVLLLGYRGASAHGEELASQLDDHGVAGQIIHALYFMRARGFTARVWPFLEDEKAWIRKEARRYLAWEAGG
jgi:hypothetical protein